MKKVAAIGLSLFMVLMLVACGASPEKKQEVRDKYDQLIALRDELQGLIDDFESEVGGPLPSVVSTEMGILNRRLDELGEQIDSELDRLNKEGVEELITLLDQEITGGEEALSEFRGVIEAYREVVAKSTDLESQMLILSEKYIEANTRLTDLNSRGVTISQSIIDEATSLQTDIQEMSGDASREALTLQDDDIEGAIVLLDDYLSRINALIERTDALLAQIDTLG